MKIKIARGYRWICKDCKKILKIQTMNFKKECPYCHSKEIIFIVIYKELIKFYDLPN